MRLHSLLAGAGLATCLPCWAVLGGTPLQLVDNSLQAVGVPVRVARMTSATTPYTVQQRALESGVVVREYVDAGNKVFAVTWQGPVQPDLQALLGPHFQALLHEGARRPHAGHAQVRLDDSELVVVSRGRLRAFHGLSYLRSALPSGFSVEDLQ